MEQTNHYFYKLSAGRHHVKDESRPAVCRRKTQCSTQLLSRVCSSQDRLLSGFPHFLPVLLLSIYYVTPPYCVASCQSSSVTMPRCGIAFPFPVLGTSYPFLSLLLELIPPHPHEIYLQTPHTLFVINVVSSGVNEPMLSRRD